jgi:hypothetical protein
MRDGERGAGTCAAGRVRADGGSAPVGDTHLCAGAYADRHPSAGVKYYHVSANAELVPYSQPQLYVYGYNASGRPDGIWFASGDTWREFGFRQRRESEFMHEVSPDWSRLARVADAADMQRLYEIGAYWVNYEYFDLDFRDALTGIRYVYSGRLRLQWSGLQKTPGQTMREILLQNSVIFDRAEDAIRKCNFYAQLNPEVVERFRFPDWGQIARQFAGVWCDFSADSVCARYFWYQSLDASSGCIWDADAIRVVGK